MERLGDIFKFFNVLNEKKYTFFIKIVINIVIHINNIQYFNK